MSLFPPEQLQTALEHVQRHLPGHLGLAIGYDEDEILKYYELPVTQPLNIANKIRGIITIPLVNTGQVFNIYQAIPFPNRMPNSTVRERFIWNGPPQYFAVTSDHKGFMHLGTHFNTDACVKNQPLICPAQLQTLETSKDNCLYQLFTGRMDEGRAGEPCQFQQYQSTQGVVAAITEEDWAISVNKPTTLQTSCTDLDRPHQPLIARPNLNLISDHILHLPRHCTATLEGKVIPLRLQLQSESNGTQEYQPKTNTNALLQMYGESMKDRQIADNFLRILQQTYKATSTGTRDYDTTQLQTALAKMTHMVNHASHQPGESTTHLIFGVTSLISSLAVIGCIVFLVYKYQCWKTIVTDEPRVNLTINFDENLPHQRAIDV
jgi:hypothetical protein